MNTKRDKHKLLLQLNRAMNEYHTDDARLDYCGAWCNNDILDRMLSTPTKNEACKHLQSLIEFKIEKYAYDGVNFKKSIECIEIAKELEKAYIYIHELLEDGE